MLSCRNVLGGPFAAAVLENMQGIKGMHAWQWCESIRHQLVVGAKQFSHAH
jgi:hypothetical protein